MNIRFAHTDEENRWNERILSNPNGGNVFQGKEFAEQKKMSGWVPRFIIIDKLSMTIHEKHVFGLGKLWYVPKGPDVSSPVQIGAILSALHDFAYKNSVFCIKIEPEIIKTDDAVKVLDELGLRPVKNIQPSSTIIIDLSPDLNTILMNLNQKGRHAIRRAERDDVTVERVKATDKNCKIFYDLLTVTASSSFSIRKYDYYRRYWQRYESAGMGSLFFASVDGAIVSAAFAMVFGHKSTYKDGASVRERPVYGASHLLQWHVIQWAKEMGSTEHDLLGSPPSDLIKDETHPYYGFGRFKSSFNKHVTDYVGAYDIMVRPRQYAIWSRYGERIVKRLWWSRHHENWY